MKKLSVLLVAMSLFPVVASANPYQFDTSMYNNMKSVDVGSFFEGMKEGAEIRQLMEQKKERERALQAQKDLNALDLRNKEQIMAYVKKYPEKTDKVIELLKLQAELDRIN